MLDQGSIFAVSFAIRLLEAREWLPELRLSEPSLHGSESPGISLQHSPKVLHCGKSRLGDEQGGVESKNVR